MQNVQLFDFDPETVHKYRNTWSHSKLVKLYDIPIERWVFKFLMIITLKAIYVVTLNVKTINDFIEISYFGELLLLYRHAFIN